MRVFSFSIAVYFNPLNRIQLENLMNQVAKTFSSHVQEVAREKFRIIDVQRQKFITVRLTIKELARRKHNTQQHKPKNLKQSIRETSTNNKKFRSTQNRNLIIRIFK